MVGLRWEMHSSMWGFVWHRNGTRQMRPFCVLPAEWPGQWLWVLHTALCSTWSLQLGRGTVSLPVSGLVALPRGCWTHCRGNCCRADLSCTSLKLIASHSIHFTNVCCNYLLWREEYHKIRIRISCIKPQLWLKHTGQVESCVQGQSYEKCLLVGYCCGRHPNKYSNPDKTMIKYIFSSWL